MNIEGINIDCHGVLANFTQQVADDFGVDVSEISHVYGLWEPLGIGEQEFWKWLHARPAKWWATLPAFPWALELVEFCRTLAPVTFATAACKSPAGYAGTMQWLLDVFGDVYDQTMMGSAKQKLSHRGEVLIDDLPKNCDKFRERGGEAILFPRFWNGGQDHAHNPLGHVCYQLGKLSRHEVYEDKCEEKEMVIQAREVSIEYDPLEITRIGDPFPQYTQRRRMVVEF